MVCHLLPSNGACSQMIFCIELDVFTTLVWVQRPLPVGAPPWVLPVFTLSRTVPVLTVAPLSVRSNSRSMSASTGTFVWPSPGPPPLVGPNANARRVQRRKRNARKSTPSTFGRYRRKDVVVIGYG